MRLLWSAGAASTGETSTLLRDYAHTERARRSRAATFFHAPSINPPSRPEDRNRSPKSPLDDLRWPTPRGDSRRRRA